MENTCTAQHSSCTRIWKEHTRKPRRSWPQTHTHTHTHTSKWMPMYVSLYALFAIGTMGLRPCHTRSACRSDPTVTHQTHAVFRSVAFLRCPYHRSYYYFYLFFLHYTLVDLEKATHSSIDDSARQDQESALHVLPLGTQQVTSHNSARTLHSPKQLDTIARTS